MKILEVKTERREIGSVGERAAARHLRLRGYKILKRGYVANGHEIDIIAENRDYTVFVEVKTRTLGKKNPAEPRPAAAVTPEKQRSIISTAKFFLGTHPRGKRVRFDIIEAYLDERKRVKELTHLEGAFNANTAHGR